MTSEWREVSLGDAIELKRGYDLPRQKRNIGDIPIVSSSGVTAFHSEAMAKGPGVVTGRYGTLGQVFYLSQDFWPLNTTLYVRDFKGNDPEFISYFLRSIDFFAYSDKAAVPGLNRNDLHRAKVQIPPLAEQRTIAHILGTLDDKIELNRRMNQTLEAMAQALFKSWFVDFDGVPPEEMQESELGLIPKGWKVGTLADLTMLNPEKWTKRTRPDEIRYVDLSNTKNGKIESVVVYDSENAPSRAQHVLRSNDTIVGTVRPGNGSYALITEEGLTGSTGFAVLRPKCNDYAQLVYLAATARSTIDSLANLADGAAYPAVRPEVVAATRIVIAGTKTIAAFATCTAPLFEKIAKNQRQSRTLAHIRDALLPQLLSGKLSVAHLQDQIKP